MPHLPEIRDDGLQLDENRSFQNRFWKGERVAWCVYALLILGALVGLTGSGGALSAASVGVGASELTYPRFARWQSADQMTIVFGGDTDTYRVELGPRFLDYFSIEGIQPRPVQSLTSASGTVFEFRTEQAGAGKATFGIRPNHPGIANVDGKIGRDDFHMTTFILP